MASYKTIKAYGKAEHVEKKSRFIGEAFPVKTEEEVRQILEQVKKSFWDASHHVFAYRLQNGEARFSDDGEPSGTAGKPTLDVILGTDVRDVLVVVTRYFGGTLLGTGGLVRAYSKGARIALEAAGIVSMEPFYSCQIVMDYTYLSKIQYLLREKGYPEEGSEYTHEVTLRFLVPEKELENFQKKVLEVSDGRLQLQASKHTKYVPIPVQNS